MNFLTGVGLLMIGGLLGVLVMCLMIVASDLGDDDEER